MLFGSHYTCKQSQVQKIATQKKHISKSLIREADANETSGELGSALPGNLVGNSQFKIQKLEPDTMLSNIVPLVSVELEYHDEW